MMNLRKDEPDAIMELLSALQKGRVVGLPEYPKARFVGPGGDPPDALIELSSELPQVGVELASVLDEKFARESSKMAAGKIPYRDLALKVDV